MRKRTRLEEDIGEWPNRTLRVGAGLHYGEDEPLKAHDFDPTQAFIAQK